MTDEARRIASSAAEVAARTSYGKLLALLSTRLRDIPAAEDALAEAFAAALRQWPGDGVPENPAGWLLTVARRKSGHSDARKQTARSAIGHLNLLHEERAAERPEAFGDKRLELMFVCAHPAIEVEAQAPLMLQTVLGLDAARIAGSFLVSATTMGQRLYRAKKKIREAGVGFDVPDLARAGDRVESVLGAIYASFGAAWEDVYGADGKLAGLSSEAIWLASLLVELLPENPEAKGLLALMLYCEARRPARRDQRGRFISLYRQNVALWSRPMIAEAEALLRSAAKYSAPARYQTEAAIQSLHVHQHIKGERFKGQLVHLYDLLAQHSPTVGVLVARAAAYAEEGDPDAGLALLDEIEGAAEYQPWWAARARCYWLAGEELSAREAAKRAAGLTNDPAVRDYLLSAGFSQSI